MHILIVTHSLNAGGAQRATAMRAIRALIRDLKPDLTIGMTTSASVLVKCAGLGLPSRTLERF